MTQQLYIPILLGTNRQGRASEAVARFVYERMREDDRMRTQFFDVRAFVLPSDDYGEAVKDKNPEWRDAMKQADGLVVVTPEYNHGYPGTLKAALDLLYAEYEHKAAGVVGVSSGPWGGTHAVENLLPVLHHLGLSTTAHPLTFPNAPELSLTSRETQKRITMFLDRLVWLATALRWGRESLS